MKKTIFLLICTIVMTSILFFSGTNLLELVARSDMLLAYGETGDGDGGGDVYTAPDIQIGVPGFSILRQVDADTVDNLVKVLRGFKQEMSEPVNILLLASDAGDMLTDAIMVMHYNPKTSQINILSIPRDTYVTISGLKTHKVNGVFASSDGYERLKTTLENMLKQKINYYVHLNLKTIREVVDLLDGVEYDVPCEMIYDDPDQNLHINLKKGRRTLTGKQVEGLLRFRHPNKWTKEVKQHYDGSDIKRIARQHDFFNEMIKQKINIKYIAKYGDIVNTVYSNIKTDLTLPEMLKFAQGIPSISPDKFQTATLPGYAKTIDKLSYYIHDQKQSIAIADTMLNATPPSID